MELIVIKDRVVGSFGVKFDDEGDIIGRYGVYMPGIQSLETKEHYQELVKCLKDALEIAETNLNLKFGQ